MTSAEKTVQAQNLSKIFGDKTAVDQVSFEVHKGEVFGFLGPNGAGKTTTIKMLTTLLAPTSGRASILGFDLRSDGGRIRERIGVVQQQDSFDQGLNTETSMQLYGLIWNVGKEERSKRIDELVKRFGMEEFRKMPTIDLSAGQRRRLQVAREFVHDMDLLFLDEPTVGLDAIVRRNVLDYFKEKVKEGLTIFFTTHILEEAEYLCNRIAVINQGKLVQVDSPENLKRRFGTTKAVEFRLLEGRSDSLQRELESNPEIEKVAQDETGSYRVTTSKPEYAIPEVYRLAVKHMLHISSIYIAETTLEDAFISMVKESGSKSVGHQQEGAR